MEQSRQIRIEPHFRELSTRGDWKMWLYPYLTTLFQQRLRQMWLKLCWKQTKIKKTKKKKKKKKNQLKRYILHQNDFPSFTNIEFTSFVTPGTKAFFKIFYQHRFPRQRPFNMERWSWLQKWTWKTSEDSCCEWCCRESCQTHSGIQ